MMLLGSVLGLLATVGLYSLLHRAMNAPLTRRKTHPPEPWWGGSRVGNVVVGTVFVVLGAVQLWLGGMLPGANGTVTGHRAHAASRQPMSYSIDIDSALGKRNLGIPEEATRTCLTGTTYTRWPLSLTFVCGAHVHWHLWPFVGVPFLAFGLVVLTAGRRRPEGARWH